ncbi:hypothetical protein GCM10023115_00110 [Pontixanthobacter gangjinensis]|uniref:Pilus assembly protein n=1 Tax=Pontixanthobacter gangjinensis TaxID=1028742 RepID=A0A6I4SHS0_9SPHN|nr:TadE/TadG family type IV pilus assembly protein [Pontixanthobacter gangjinensis]MXO55261.1 pilus assembly protein [Pontixanthobacter gangjinensis]
MMIRRFSKDTRATTAAEFAMILPLALLMMFGVIDVGVYAWTLNEYEKATQMGARYAVVTNVLSPALSTQTYIGFTCDNGQVLAASDRICGEALGAVICTGAVCTCDSSAGTCPSGSLSPADSADYDALVARMRQFQPRIPDGSVSVEYRGSGIGFAGDPNKPEIAPIVTVRVNNVNYSSIVLSPLGGQVPLPDFSYSLTLEDGQGSVSS